jgi:putative membrane protein
MMYWGDHMSTGDWVFSLLGTLIVLALIVATIVWLVSTLSDRGRGTNASAPSAREILDRRLASGELTVEQYEQLREALSDGQSATRDPQPPRPAGESG